MSEASSDPPVPPPNAPSSEQAKAESSSAAAETAAATGDDVKMEEAKPVEETWDDIPESVLNVSTGGEKRQGQSCSVTTRDSSSTLAWHVCHE